MPPAKRSTKKKPAHRAVPQLVVGVDTGGTFTDVVFRDGNEVGRFKLLSTPEDPGRAVIEALTTLFGERAPDLLTYGTTVATNAMLERRGVKTALITTAGFEDVLEIGRQARPNLYALEPVKPEPLVPAARRFGIEERMLHDGSVETKTDPAELARLATRLARSGVRSIAVCLLHAHANPKHERAVARALSRLDAPVTLSHVLSSEAGEFERTSTAVANAYVRPMVAGHVAALERRSRAGRFRVLQSNGGAIGGKTAGDEPVRTMLSGPAGGVSAAARLCARMGIDRLVTFDMGGTSTDVSMVDREIPRRAITEIGDIPVRSPSIDIHTVGAGGGSIAYLDPGGSLKVGPESAGADPGPACYGVGNLPTVTDANVVLGRLRPEAFLGGAMKLNVERARDAVAPLARRMGAASVEAAAEGIVRVVEGNMERAVRVITVERGQDPRSCALVTFGGAAGLHGCGLARGLDMQTVVVPRDPGLLSAWGVLEGPVIRDVSVPVQLVNPAAGRLRASAAGAAAQAKKAVSKEGVPASRIGVACFARVRYLGQSLELEVPLGPGLAADFDREHERLLHTCDPHRDIEVTSIRVTAISEAGASAKARTKKPRARKAVPERSVTVFVDGRSRRVPCFERGSLPAGARIEGPAIVTEYSSTVLVAPGWRATVDAEGNLVMEARDA